ncbi:MAG: metallophosphoesterase [Phycisphaerae bacterium]|nr:metallophosphoesterase [Phycisphaerae bacterium]
MTFSTDLRNADAVCGLLERAAGVLRGAACRRGCVHILGDRGRLVVAGDLHDNPIHLDRIVAFARLDESDEHHLVVQELIHGERLVNGVDLSYRVVAKVAALVERFPGRVHPLLANHELCQMLGIGVSKGHGDGTALFRDGLDFVFGDDSDAVADALGDFFRAMPLAVRTAHGLWCSHSIPSPETTSRFDMGIFEREIAFEDYQAPRGPAYLLVWGRGQLAEQVDQLARAWGVETFCLGHAHSDAGAHVVTPRMAVLNSDHDRGRIVEFDLSLPAPDSEAIVAASQPIAQLGASV